FEKCRRLHFARRLPPLLPRDNFSANLLPDLSRLLLRGRRSITESAPGRLLPFIAGKRPLEQVEKDQRDRDDQAFELKEPVHRQVLLLTTLALALGFRNR